MIVVTGYEGTLCIMLSLVINFTIELANYSIVLQKTLVKIFDFGNFMNLVKITRLNFANLDVQYTFYTIICQVLDRLQAITPHPYVAFL